MILKDILPASYRRVIYAVYAVIGFILGAAQVGYSTAGEGQPEWLLVALAVFGYSGIALGVTAAANTPTPAEEQAPVQVEVVDVQGKHERGAITVWQAIAIAALIIIVLIALSPVLAL